MISFFQAIIMGLVQGVTELFPISSLGHSVIVPWVLGWHSLLADQTKSQSFFLSFVVVLHLATALALLIFYRKTWIRIIKGFFSSVKNREIDSPDGRLAWLLIVATIPAGLIGLIFEDVLRKQFSKPLAAIIFLFVNGCILFAGDHFQKKHNHKHDSTDTTENVGQRLNFKRAGIIGVFQVAAFCAGISRSGITMVGGLVSGLDHEDAARFSFLLATPIILGAGIVNLSEVFGPTDKGVHGQIIVGGLSAGIAAYITVRYLDNYFKDKSLRPFAIYCVTASILLLGLGLLRGHF